MVAIVDTEEPTTTEEALNSLNSKLWQEAIQSECDSLKQNKTWGLIDLPVSKNIFGSKWIFKYKPGADEQIQQCTAHLDAQGHSQKSSVDYNEVFSPVVKYSSIRSILAIVNHLGLELH